MYSVWFVAVSKRLRCAVTVQVGFSHQDALQEALVNNMVEGHVKRRDNSFHNQRFVAKSTEGNIVPVFSSLLRVRSREHTSVLWLKLILLALDNQHPAPWPT